MILLDTSILGYAAGADRPLRAPSRRLLIAHRNGRIRAFTTVEVIQEFAHVHARRRPRSRATALARAFANALSLIQTEPSDLALGLTFFEQHPTLGAFDAVLAAAALNRQADALVSADRAFGLVPGLKWVDPATPDLDALLGP